jgi:two-component system CheB/CheR fusion protein
MDPPFTKLDIFCCRNLLIYLTPELQKRLIPLFHFILNPQGLLFLGNAESIGSFTTLFSPIVPKERIFRRCETVLKGVQLDFPAEFTAAAASRSIPATESRLPVASLQSLADLMLRTRYVPPAVLVNENGDIIYISGRTGNYLEPAAGKANWNIIAMAREGLRYELTSALQKVNRTKESVAISGVKVGVGPEERTVNVHVQALQEPKELLGMVLVVFSDAVPEIKMHPGAKGRKAPVLSARQGGLELELRHTRDEMMAHREEMQTSQEELKSVNEELQSTNEELQSTNEELMTSKEEMQSLNEELQTVNAELQSKLDELSTSNNDMKNLLNSTNIATVFLDNEMRVRRFTLQAKNIFKFIPGDVGRPITDLASNLRYPELAADAREVLRTLAVAEKPVSTIDGRWFTARIMPYRTLDNRINGVVITFANITAAKKLEANLREKHGQLEKFSAQQASRLASAEVRSLSKIARNEPGDAGARTAPRAQTAKRRKL